MSGETSELIDRFANDLKKTVEYRDYEEKRERLKRNPEKWEKTNEYRKQRFLMQRDTNDLFERMEEFEDRFAYIHKDSLIEDYLVAELTLCRLVQDMHVRIYAAIDIDVDIDIDI